MRTRPELVTVRDAAIRHLHNRVSIEELEEISIAAGRSMKADGLTLEEILVVFKGAVALAAQHVSSPATRERVGVLRAQLAPWVIKMYVQESGDFTKSHES